MWPSTWTLPSDGVRIPASTWSSVLLPAPLGPMTPSDSPFATLNVTWRRAQKSASPSRFARRVIVSRSVRLRFSLRLYTTPRSWTMIAASGSGSAAT